ncbi:MAG: hypothetical protein FWC16_01040 [Defluviitaleaceae bacterium]|nr:hypothetical protein [Defluviitaleaceae bacterium]MCL2273490.1 hypothetical protein [Defluviitaleaceae bacterium]
MHYYKDIWVQGLRIATGIFFAAVLVIASSTIGALPVMGQSADGINWNRTIVVRPDGLWEFWEDMWARTQTTVQPGYRIVNQGTRLHCNRTKIATRGIKPSSKYKSEEMG